MMLPVLSGTDFQDPKVIKYIVFPFDKEALIVSLINDN